MKKVFRFLTVFVAVAAYACLFTSCSKDDDLGNLSFLYTTWYLDDDADETLTFSKNGTYVWRYNENERYGGWEEKGTFTIKATPKGKLNYRLTCTYSDEGEECTDVYDVVDFDMGDYRILELYMIGGEDYSPTFVNNKKYVESRK